MQPHSPSAGRPLGPSRRRAQLQALVDRVTVRSDAVEIAIRLSAVCTLGETSGAEPEDIAKNGPLSILVVPARIRRSRSETRLLVEASGGSSKAPEPDRSLLRLLGQAHRFRDMITSGQDKSLAELAVEAGVSASYLTRVFRLSFLAPSITRAILEGRQPAELTAYSLLLAGKPGALWSDQREQFGFR